MVRSADDLIGRFVRGLDERGLRESTLVVVCGDNGSPRQVGGGKGRTTAVGTHVPLMVSWPGTLPRNRVEPDLIDLVDVFPTLLELCGRPIPADREIDGHSFASLMLGSLTLGPILPAFADHSF